MLVVKVSAMGRVACRLVRHTVVVGLPQCVWAQDRVAAVRGEGKFCVMAFALWKLIANFVPYIVNDEASKT